MSKPEDIPQDVWDAAENAFDLMLCNDIQASGTSQQFRIDSIEPHARAILAERERCAKQIDPLSPSKATPRPMRSRHTTFVCGSPLPSAMEAREP